MTTWWSGRVSSSQMPAQVVFSVILPMQKMLESIPFVKKGFWHNCKEVLSMEDLHYRSRTPF